MDSVTMPLSAKPATEITDCGDAALDSSECCSACLGTEEPPEDRGNCSEGNCCGIVQEETSTDVSKCGDAGDCGCCENDKDEIVDVGCKDEEKSGCCGGGGGGGGGDRKRETAPLCCDEDENGSCCNGSQRQTAASECADGCCNDVCESIAASECDGAETRGCCCESLSGVHGAINSPGCEDGGCCGSEDKGCEDEDKRGCCSGKQHGIEVASGCEDEKQGYCDTRQSERIGLEGKDSETGRKYDSGGSQFTSRKQSQEVDEKWDVDGDSACMCCINVLINEPLSSLSSPHIVNDLADAAITQLGAHMNTLRACCNILRQYCVRRACCFTSHPATTSATSSAPRPTLSNDLPRVREAPRRSSVAKSSQDSAEVSIVAGETLHLEIRGMDCASCMTKVGRALTQLPSVTPVNLDYFSGTAELRHDGEIITAPAIVSYVTRATGFGIKALSGDSGLATVVTLPLRFPTVPPPTAFEDFDTQIGSDPHTIEVSFPVDFGGSRRPREVLEHFKPLGAELVPAGNDGTYDIATRDLINVSIRTTACAILSIPVLVLAWANLPARPILYGAISAGFTTLIQALAFPIISSACRSVIYLRQADMDVLVAFSTLTAYLFSIISFAFGAAGRPFASAFFETSALLVTLIFLGRTMSAATRRSTGSALRELHRLQPTDVLLVSAEGASSPQSIDCRLVYYGDIIRIPPETRIATDGLIVAGSSDVDESSVTGEGVAVRKQPGSRLMAGTLNLSGTLDVQVTRLTHENSLSRITTLVKQAQASHSPIQQISDRLAALILPIAAVSACVAFLVWVLVGRYVQHRSATSSSVDALTYAIAILVISCPCAIGLAVPVVTSVAIRIGIREGILFRTADALEGAHHINVMAFDKTGTLTQGELTTQRAEILVEGAEWVVDALVKDNKHPVSQGVHNFLVARLTSTAKMVQLREGALTDVVSLPGKGIKASLHGFPILGGNANFTGASSHPLYSDLCASGLTIFTVTLAGQPIALFGLADTPRPGASALVAELVRRGKDVIILSGDTPSAVHHLAKTIGVPIDDTYAGCSPEDKDAAIAALRAKGKRVCFVGDGTNDGPALSRANMALAVGGGSDVALTAASAVLLGSDLRRGVLALLDVAGAARMHVRGALLWCVVYNVFAILLASGVLVKVRIEPRWAGIGEVVSILPVFCIGFGLDARWRWWSKG